jgi:uncharacterized damage-inducible protein DinB
MEELAELHRFNAWANRNLVAGVRRLQPEQLDERRDGMYRPIRGALTHLAQVEAAYLAMMEGRAVDLPEDSSLDAVERLLEHTGTGLVELARGEDLSRTFHIPWFQRDVTLFQGLGQVLTHSTNHRADVNQWLPWFGVESTPQDYIQLVLSE